MFINCRFFTNFYSVKIKLICLILITVHEVKERSVYGPCMWGLLVFRCASVRFETEKRSWESPQRERWAHQHSAVCCSKGILFLILFIKMGKWCFVPNCTSGYKSNPEKISVFTPPKNDKLLTVSIKNIPRKTVIRYYRILMISTFLLNIEIIHTVKKV